MGGEGCYHCTPLLLSKGTLNSGTCCTLHVSCTVQCPVLIEEEMVCYILLVRVRNCALLVASATKNFALVTRISQLVVNQVTTLFHAMIFTQSIALIFSQIDQNKIQSLPPVGHFLFAFPLLWRYKTDFLVL